MRRTLSKVTLECNFLDISESIVGVPAFDSRGAKSSLLHRPKVAKSVVELCIMAAFMHRPTGKLKMWAAKQEN